jgi:hypothetical protein
LNSATEDAKLVSVSTDAKRMGVIGEIMVKLYRAECYEREGKKVVHQKLLSKGPEEVHEKALKGQAKSLGVL